ncbi:hypothetical protein ACFW9D_05535 [Streptomyces sp. NPDC059524]|uniref:hypothetical protein n=1 Tax=Streptomyces sp. NPDC059524 TaxID=3346856 RepID=UPI0036B8E70A
MRRPTQHHTRRHTASAWAHPYTGVAALGTLYADGGDEQQPPVPAPPKPAPPAAPSPTFTQEDLERIAAKEKAQGQRAGARQALDEFAAEHGFTTVDDAKAFIAAARKAQQDALSEEEKRRQELEKREQDLAAREAAAIARERAAARRAVLVGLGATGDDLEDAAALLRVADDADEQAVADAAEKLKERRPELFGVKPQTPPSQLPPAPGSAPAGGSPARQPASKEDAWARARARAVKMGHAKPDAA